VAKTTEKLVLSFDEESQSYRPAGHNLLPEQALEQTDKLQTEGRKSLIVDQQGHHRALSFHQCKPCKKAADEATSNQGQTSEEEQQTAAASAEESEGE
jgi:hypothetical protein